MSLEIIRIIFFVKDVAKSAEFYRDIIGLEIIGEINSEWTELKAGGCNLALHRSSATSAKKGDSGVKIVFATADVEKSKSELESKGLKMGKLITYEKIKFCDGTDPDGNKFQFSDRGVI
ncbi:MAG: VOC family protein [bacterium]|nr:VOC family protein [bacterium]